MTPRFRLYDPSDQKIREVAEIDWSLGIVGTCGGAIEHELDKVVLMQSTGLKDKNGVEIFEGDLVEHDDNLNGDWETFEACEVVYDKDYAQFCFKWDAGNFLTDYRNLNVIGNIYENSELLEEQR
ncbi:TPA: YopX family protein [Enterococcus faecium]